MAASAAGSGAGMPGKRKCVAGLLLLAVALAGMAVPSAAAVYTVGDSAKWTIIGSPNYTAWAASKTFHVGDTVVFEYNTQFHNVEVVSKADYKSCNTGSAQATYKTGNDSIPLKTTGHHYFLCGVPGHCLSGQRVDINVLASATAPGAAPSASSPGSSSSSVPPAPSPAAGGSAGAGAPSPQKSRASPGASRSYVMGCAVGLLAVAISSLRL